jgi:adenine phosphoribosyltransferase
MDLKSYIRNVADFPKPGINFKDITTLLKDKMAFDAAIDAMLAPFAEQPVDYYVGIESRGFYFCRCHGHQEQRRICACAQTG